MYANDPSLNTAELSAAKKLSFCGTTVPRYLRTSSGCSVTASPNEQKTMPSSANWPLNVVATETLSNTASTATPDGATPASASRSRIGTPSFSYIAKSSGSTSSSDFGPSSFDFGADQ